MASFTLAAVETEKATDKVVRFTESLESDPLARDAEAKRQWLVEWVVETPDYTVTVCNVLGAIPDTTVPHGPELLGQQMFGNVTYQIRNPGQPQMPAAQIAGVESVLRAYSSILAKEPTARISYLDELLAKKSDGRLHEHLKSVIALNCSASTGALATKATTAPDAEEHEQPNREFELLMQGRKLLDAGEPQRAIVEAFDPVIQTFETEREASDKRFYSARSAEHAVMYAALPNDDKKAVEVLGPDWADAHLLKGYALIELKQLDEAQQELQAAVALAPFESQYLSELAFLYQARGDCDRSISTYAEAESVADLGPDDQKTDNKTRALRGQGYCLIEQGKLSEAETIYRKALELDPRDKKAQGELEYIWSSAKKK